jgi:hypothetical protein
MANRIAIGDCDYVNNSVVYNSTTVSNNAALNTSLAGNGNVFTATNPLNNTLGNQRVNVDPRATSAAPSGVTLAPVSATFFISASYAGAFNPQETAMWTDDWTVFDANHALPTASR